MRNDNIVLLSTQATQSIAPTSEYKVIHNINNQVINNQVIEQSNVGHSNVRQLLRCIVKTTDVPNMEYLKVGERYKIYSIVELYSSTIPVAEYIFNSLIKVDNGYKYRPILDTILTYFECNINRNTSTWTITFNN